MSDIQDQVKQIVVDHLGIDESKVVPEAKFIDINKIDKNSNICHKIVYFRESDQKSELALDPTGQKLKDSLLGNSYLYSSGLMFIGQDSIEKIVYEIFYKD
mgnify:CR=1 FL=1